MPAALPTVIRKLMDAGFIDVEHRLSFAGQAYLIRCRKPMAKVVVRKQSQPAVRNGRSRFVSPVAGRTNGLLATTAS